MSGNAAVGPLVADPAAALGDRFREVRSFTEHLCEPLVPEDYVVQTMEDVSPTKWHLAHTSWFFETFVICELFPDYQPPHPLYPYLFNSYYVQAGERHCRPKRGLISRPTVEEIYRYRRLVDEYMERVFKSEEALERFAPIVEIGLNHEQQHQELLVTDIKHVLAQNPLSPVYRAVDRSPGTSPAPLGWVDFDEGIREVGHHGTDFAYDNERPRHRVFLEPFSVADRLITVGEYLEFMEDGGYERQEIWLSDGWAEREREDWSAPLYWENHDGQWKEFTLNGFIPVNPNEPITHISYYEADAFARWAGARLATEFEWETAADEVAVRGNFVDEGQYHPVPLAAGGERIAQLYGDVWEWTSSHYSPYPGYQAPPGAIGEYNGKFMANQFVLRGGSCATSASHVRRTYRNFFHAPARWQFTGIRLARSA